MERLPRDLHPEFELIAGFSQRKQRKTLRLRFTEKQRWRSRADA